MEDPNEMQVQNEENVQTANNESQETEQNLAANTAETTPTSEPAADAPCAAEEPVQEAAMNTAEENVVEEEPIVDYTGRSREELIENLKELLQEDIEKIRNRVSSLKNTFTAANKEVQKAQYEAFLADGGEKENYESKEDSIAEAFHKLYGEYRERRQRRIEEKEAEKQQNLEKKRGLIEELRQLIASEEPIKKIYDDFNAIQERWKSIGDVPRTEMNDLWQNYHFQVEQFFNKVKINKELKMLDLKKNLEQKVTLCEKAEELIVEPSVTKAFKELQGLRDQWKEIGPVPSEQNDEVWSRFCNAADQVSTRHREYFEKRREEQEKNLLAKQALIDKATEVTATLPTNAKGWNEVSDQLDEMLKIWKTIGPVPREQNEDIWKNFKGIIDGFYTQKREHFDSIKDEQTENYNKKIDLCQKAEAIAKRDDWKKATQELLDLQEEWKHIGTVSRKVSEKVWQRFRGACDEFFARKSEFFSTSRANEKENLEKKEAIIEQLRNFEFGDNKEENLGVIKDFQRQWMEIGHVPMSEKDRVQKEFRSIINEHFEKMKISAREAEENAYRDRIRHSAGDMKFSSNEKATLQDKIEKLRSDLSLWENNLGFLANSKQADLLKAEFEKKMQNARQQIALLEAKLKILFENENKAKEAPAQEEAVQQEETPVQENGEDVQ